MRSSRANEPPTRSWTWKQVIDMLKEESDDTLRALAEGALFTSSTLSTFGGAEEPAAPKEEAAETEEAAAAAQASSDEEELFLCVSNTFLDLQAKKKPHRKSAPGSIGISNDSSGDHVERLEQTDAQDLTKEPNPLPSMDGDMRHILGSSRANGPPTRENSF